MPIKRKIKAKKRTKTKRTLLTKSKNQNRGFYNNKQINMLSRLDGSGVRRKVTSPINYFSALANLHKELSPVDMPGYNHYPRHNTYKRKFIELGVNSSGNLRVNIPISTFSYMNPTSSLCPGFIIKDNLYTDVNTTTLALTTWSANTLLPLGDTCLNNLSYFDYGYVTACNIEFKISGVSMLNRKGLFTLVESYDTNYIISGNTGAANIADLNITANASPRATMIRNPNTFIQDLAKSDTEILYRWVPNYGPREMTQYDIEENSVSSPGFASSTGAGGERLKVLDLYISGADPLTLVEIIFTISYSGIPSITYMDQLPLTWPSCFVDITSTLQKLASDQDFIFHSENKSNKNFSPINVTIKNEEIFMAKPQEEFGQVTSYINEIQGSRKHR